MASERTQRRIDSLLDEAEEAIANLDWTVVQARAQAVLALDPANQDAINYLAASDRAFSVSAPSPTDQPANLAPTTPDTTPKEPTSFANGRYQVKRLLGEGGKKKVYLAQDTSLDREVAFALINTDGLSRNDSSGQIFISHVGEDSPVAIPIATALEARGYSTWYYERDSVPGPAYLAQMGEAIAQSQAVVIIISPLAIGSNQMTTEVVRAHESNKPLIPLLKEISHEEFQTQAPVWRQALGASTSMGVTEERVEEVVDRVVEGLETMGIKPDERRVEEDRSRVMREAQAMGRLGSHPNIVTVFDVGEHEGQPYLVTELMSGGDVEVMIGNAPGQRMPLDQAVTIAKETCRGLEFAHSKGIVHRDLKPSNIWLTGPSTTEGGPGKGFGTAKIGDFGLAAVIGGPRITQEGMMLGTVSYMPPEQAIGGEVTPRSDLYSLGAMLYEMVTGRPPFLGDDAVAIIGQHINTPPVAPTWHNGQCPRPLEALIMRLLAKDPSERPESATDVLSALDAVDLAGGVEQPADSVDAAHSLDSLAGGVFVGRQREMGELKAALEDALSGRGRLVTLVGEPGIGKTRTALELATYAGLRKAQVLWGRCYEGEGAPPYWPWVQAIRSYVRDVDPDQLRSEMGAGAADIAEVVSDVREQLPGLESPQQLEPEQARFRLFDSITAFLKNAGRRQPIVLVLDDLHWADHPSLLLLEFVARELANSRVLIIGTYRDMELSRQHPLSHTLGELNRERLFQRVLLRGLDQDDVARFIELASGVTPPPGMLEAVHRQTEGNPLFVTEVVRLLVQDGELTQDSGRGEGRDSWSVRIPEGVREVIGRRLDRLSERCNETLTIASVIGREFTLGQLSPLIEDMTEDRLLEVLEEALSARVIEELPRMVGRYQFTHALIQETLSGELTTTRRARLHARIAEALEELYGDDAESHAAELAHHFVEAEGVLGTEKLIRYSLLAGDRAMAMYAYEEALGHFQRGLAAKEGGSTGSASSEQGIDAETAALLHGLGRTQLILLQVDEGWANLTRAFDYYAEVGDIPRIVDIARHPVSITAPGQIAPLLNRALDLLPPDSYEAGRLLPWYGRLLNAQQGDYEGAKEALGRALAIAQREGDLALQMQALAFSADVEGWHFHWQQSLDDALQALGMTHLVDNPLAEMFANLWARAALVAMGGDEEELMQHSEAGLAAAERLRDRVWLPLMLGWGSRDYGAWGDWQQAREVSDRGLELSPMHPDIIAYRAMLEYQLGDFEQGEVHLDRLVESLSKGDQPVNAQRVGALAIAVTGRISGSDDRFDIAEVAAEAVLSSPSITPFIANTARFGLALIAIQRADAAAASEHYAALQVHRAPLQEISGDRLMGLLAQTMGDLSQAASHFEDALAYCRNAGFRPELAWTCCDYADLLMQRNHENDHSKATSLLDESLAISEELGMRPLVERVLSRQENLKD